MLTRFTLAAAGGIVLTLVGAVSFVSADSLGAGRAPDAAAAASGAFDLQSHRGGRGEITENTLAAFSHSLDLGVTTLELDTHLTADGAVVVWHDNLLTAGKCRDTAPLWVGDPAFPYVDAPVRALTLGQIQTLDCGYRQLGGYPEQTHQPGSAVPELAEVLDLVAERGASDVRLSIETKVIEPGEATMYELTRAVVTAVRAAGLSERAGLQSFDWAALDLAQRLDPQLRLTALSRGDAWLQRGRPGASPHLGGLDIDDHGGSLARAAAFRGYDAISPAHATVTAQMVTDAHGLGLAVIPWTVSDPDLMHTLMDLGVDGLVTDHPTRLRAVMQARGLPLPG
ncbi:glycerophosphodiester phosphodiesterase [Cryobacterium roopkundense]|uniref:Glycerophosphodiester phosphodiesterase n=1 Tax=Cryobacterium roopkundense TaxID=1001240 RepID=A0A099JPM1_9MICO|nr:glycerophosphodiester phosphodiesterase family protein [Cryobacterium roopkundense]KGJ79408.1 glycerophosphodiester phosphodiesterase [Cryobacterium roopkundense]MBB5639870.1 glycerophosphoryl diester phosphodiesterase [Cryobacterium roopkundense]